MSKRVTPKQPRKREDITVPVDPAMWLALCDACVQDVYVRMIEEWAKAGAVGEPPSPLEALAQA